MQNEEDTLMIDFKKLIGLKTGFRSKPDMGVGNVAVRRISCVCDSGIPQLSSVWKIRLIISCRKDIEQTILVN